MPLIAPKILLCQGDLLFLPSCFPFAGALFFTSLRKLSVSGFANKDAFYMNSENQKQEKPSDLSWPQNSRITEPLRCKEPLDYIFFIQTLHGSSRFISISLSKTMSTQILNICTDGGCWLLYDDCQFRKFYLYLLIETE